jgi:membrane-associated phospholipid phosphatase
MIDCLSNSNWINPQIDCLLFLQNLRIGHLECLDKFFLSITILGEFWLPTLICAIAYWCIDFRAGVYLFTLEGFNVLITHFFKMLACVYRPWILSENIHPSKLAVPFATCYSFPSGHSAMTASVVGGTAFLLRKRRFICIALILLILVVGFSRLWLGVHTPQDVICGLLTGFILIFAVNSLVNWAEKDSNRYLYIAGIVNILAVIALVYIKFFNTYRIDYVDGELLVNPQKSMYSTLIAYGFALGIINGLSLCRRFFPFNPKEYSVKKRILIGLIGSIMLILLLKYILLYIVVNVLPLRFTVPIVFLLGLFVTLIYPMIFIRINNKPAQG